MNDAPSPPATGRAAPPPLVVADLDALIATCQPIGAQIQAMADALRPAITRMGQYVGQQIEKIAQANHRATAPKIYQDRYRRHRRSCRVCNPHGNPPPSKVNSRDYARRLRNRRRRR